MAACRGFLLLSAKRMCFENGAPDGIRTHGPQIRNLMLYPAELRVRDTVIRSRKAAGQLSFVGGTTGKGNGNTDIPSSISAFAS